MINSKNLKYIQIPLVILTLFYVFVEVPYMDIGLWIVYGLVSVNIFLNGFRFKERRSHLTKLGSQENFNGGLLAGLILFAIIAIMALLGTKLVQWDVVPRRQEELSPYFITIIALPQLIQFMIRLLFKGFEESVYITNEGILFNMNISEHYDWTDFDSYAVLPDLKLIRFRKEKDSKSKFFFVSTDFEDYDQSKERILTILGENLKRELD